ncbi:MAG: winged helix-turn-helix transcriptional regulator [Firmicutes bacterium]|nr:winged helix-turn-helix transcriptional regulator [Bacillota bacterium]
MERLTDREKEILAHLQTNPMITQDELASRFNISRSSAAVHISNLMRKKAILGRGYVFNERTSVVILGEIYSWIDGQVKDAIEVISQPAVAGSIDQEWGGSGLLIAERLAAMKVPVLLLSTLGLDEESEQVLGQLRRAGIDTRYIVRSNSYRTPRVIRVARQQEEKSVIEIHDLEGLSLVSSELVQQRENLFEGAQAAFVSSCLPAETINQCLNIARGRELALFIAATVNIQPLKEVSSFDGLDYLIIDSFRLAELTHMRVAGEDGILRGAEFMRARGVSNIVVVDSQEGVFLFFADDSIRLPRLPGQDLLSRGLIHELTAGLIYGAINGYSIRQSARIGMRAIAGLRK